MGKDYIKQSVAGAWDGITSPTLKRMIELEFGYPFEKHTYYTQDGCVNSVIRIPGPKGTPNTIGVGKKKIIGKPVVIY